MFNYFININQTTEKMPDLMKDIDDQISKHVSNNHLNSMKRKLMNISLLML
jgi:flagellar hook-associated protein FlgK